MVGIVLPITISDVCRYEVLKKTSLASSLGSEGAKNSFDIHSTDNLSVENASAATMNSQDPDVGTITIPPILAPNPSHLIPIRNFTSYLPHIVALDQVRKRDHTLSMSSGDTLFRLVNAHQPASLEERELQADDIEMTVSSALSLVPSDTYK